MIYYSTNLIKTLQKTLRLRFRQIIDINETARMIDNYLEYFRVYK